MTEAWASRAQRVLIGKDRISPKELSEILGCHYLKANEILKNLGWLRSLEEIKGKKTWRVFYYRGDQEHG